MGIMSRRRRAAKDTQVMSPGSTNQATKLKKCSQLAHGSDPRRSMPGSRDGVVAAGLPPTASITAARGWPGRQRQSPRARPRIRGSAPGKAEMADRQTGWGRRNALSADKTVGRVRPSEYLDILSSASSPGRLFKKDSSDGFNSNPPPMSRRWRGCRKKRTLCLMLAGRDVSRRLLFGSPEGALQERVPTPWRRGRGDIGGRRSGSCPAAIPVSGRASPRATDGKTIENLGHVVKCKLKKKEEKKGLCMAKCMMCRTAWQMCVTNMMTTH